MSINEGTWHNDGNFLLFIYLLKLNKNVAPYYKNTTCCPPSNWAFISYLFRIFFHSSAFPKLRFTNSSSSFIHSFISQTYLPILSLRNSSSASIHYNSSSSLLSLASFISGRDMALTASLLAFSAILVLIFTFRLI